MLQVAACVWLVFAAFAPSRLYGPSLEHFNWWPMIGAAYPALSILALVVLPEKRCLTMAALGLSGALLLLGVGFGVASALESTFSAGEKVATACLLLIPGATGAALWWARRG